MASGLRCQAMAGLFWSSTPVMRVISSAMRYPDGLGDPVVDLLFGLVVAPAEAVADSGERVLGGGQGAFAGLGDGGGLLAGPDVVDAQPVDTAGALVEDLPVVQYAFPHGAVLFGQPSSALGAVLESR